MVPHVPQPTGRLPTGSPDQEPLTAEETPSWNPATPHSVTDVMVAWPFPSQFPVETKVYELAGATWAYVEYLPAGQLTHDVSHTPPAELENVPAGHAAHDAAPAEENVPAGQSKQLV
jgi:hypothetical protein